MQPHLVAHVRGSLEARAVQRLEEHLIDTRLKMSVFSSTNTSRTLDFLTNSGNSFVLTHLNQVFEAASRSESADLSMADKR